MPSSIVVARAELLHVMHTMCPTPSEYDGRLSCCNDRDARGHDDDNHITEKRERGKSPLSLAEGERKWGGGGCAGEQRSKRLIVLQKQTAVSTAVEI